MDVPKEYIRQTEFCRRLGITLTGLQKAAQRGRVRIEEREGKKRIEWHENRRTYIESARTPARYTTNSILKRKKENVQNHNQDPEQKKINYNNGFHPMDLVPEPEDKDGDFRPSMSRLEAESVKQIYLAKQAKLKFLKSAGILIETALVQREWEEIAIRVKRAMLTIPDRVAELFASTSDAVKIHNDLSAEIIHALSSLQYKVKFEEKDENFEELIDEDGEPEDSEVEEESTEA